VREPALAPEGAGRCLEEEAAGLGLAVVEWRWRWRSRSRRPRRRRRSGAKRRSVVVGSLSSSLLSLVFFFFFSLIFIVAAAVAVPLAFAERACRFAGLEVAPSARARGAGRIERLGRPARRESFTRKVDGGRRAAAAAAVPVARRPLVAFSSVAGEIQLRYLLGQRVRNALRGYCRLRHGACPSLSLSPFTSSIRKNLGVRFSSPFFSELFAPPRPLLSSLQRKEIRKSATTTTTKKKKKKRGTLASGREIRERETSRGGARCIKSSLD